jgi:hypothetical protein
MRRPRRHPASTPADDWAKWTTELPPTVIMQLKVRAALERRPMRETLRAAVEAYLTTAVPR